jgi:hypothetical protein
MFLVFIEVLFSTTFNPNPQKHFSHNIFVPCLSIASINSSQHNFITDSVS